MRRMLVSALMLSLFSFSVVGLSGCAEEEKATKKETVSGPGGTDTKETTVKEKKTGDMKDGAPTTTP